MKRETRSFIVEVRRGSKKQNAPFLPPPPETPQEEKPPLRRAEEILFSRESDPGKAPVRTGRILEPLAEQSVPAAAPEPPPPPEEPAKRRGRPPGSKNRPLEAKEVTERSGRGRPRQAPEGRRLELTPELVDAAMQSMTKLSPGMERQDLAEARESDESRGFDEAGASAPWSPKRIRRSRPEASHGAAPELPFEDATGDAAPRPPTLARPMRSRDLPLMAAGVLRRSDFRRLFKPAERWKGRIRLRALIRRSKLREA